MQPLLLLAAILAIGCAAAQGNAPGQSDPLSDAVSLAEAGNASSSIVEPPWREMCPYLAQLERADPVADAAAAFARGDRRLLMVGGVVGAVPTSRPVPQRMVDRALMIPETSDTSEGCLSMDGIDVALLYANRYNDAMLGHIPSRQRR